MRGKHRKRGSYIPNKVTFNSLGTFGLVLERKINTTEHQVRQYPFDTQAVLHSGRAKTLPKEIKDQGKNHPVRAATSRYMGGSR